jgi:hypothetical protein
VTLARNALGLKGVGEGGAVAALANAVEDALTPFGVNVTEGVTAVRVAPLIRAAPAAR